MKSRFVTAFGTSKSLTTWTRDKRCKVTYGALHARLMAGWHPEKAIITPTGHQKRYRAWGQSKTMAMWARDKRCKVAFGTLEIRLRNGMNPKVAIATPAGKLVRVRTASALARIVHIWNQSKTVAAWSKDKRCKVSYGTLYHRLMANWQPEKAITTPSRHRQHQRGKTYRIWDEEKTLKQWSKDKRCKVTYGTLRDRIERKGLDPKQAITQKLRFVWRQVQVTILGETKSLAEWSKDPECGVRYELLAKRLKTGVTSENLLNSTDMKAISAFGEAKPLKAWSRDKRCVVSYLTLFNRVKYMEMSVEQAMTIPTDELRLYNFFTNSCKGKLFGYPTNERLAEMLTQLLERS